MMYTEKIDGNGKPTLAFNNSLHNSLRVGIQN